MTSKDSLIYPLSGLQPTLDFTDLEDIPREGMPSILSVLPLRDSVVYPMLIAPLSVGRESTTQAIDDAVAHRDRIIGVVTQRNGDTDSPGPNDLYDIGCAVVIRSLVKMSDATRLVAQGLHRFRIVEVIQEEPFLKVRVDRLEEPEPREEDADEIEAVRRAIADQFNQAVELSPILPDELRGLTLAVSEPNVLTDLVAAHMVLTTEEKQEILSTLPLLDRMRALLAMLGREVQILQLTSRVQSEVNQELTRSQREHVLREQLKAIQRELGDADPGGEDLCELSDRLRSAGMPDGAESEALREFQRLRRTPIGSPEGTVIRTYLETLATLPWVAQTDDNLDVGHAQRVLDTEHFGLEKIKDRILDFLAVRIMQKGIAGRQPILCFVGPPGVGKTSLGRSIASALGRKFARISLGGVRDEAEIRGHRRTYIGAMPGQIISQLRRAGTRNPVFVLDEIDKLTSDVRGDPSSALLEVLDPEQNSEFRDLYLDVPFDLSQVFFIATANRLDTIPPALRDRMEIIELGGYTEEEKVEIALRHLVPKQVAEHGLSRGKIRFDAGGLRHLVRLYTREAGVRNLEREIAGVVRKAVRRFAEGRKAPVKVSPDIIEASLGAPRFTEDPIAERPMVPGVAVGLAWTPVGGDLLFIEAAQTPGQGLLVTGQLGDVMKESVQAALTFLRANAAEINIEPPNLKEREIHVHVPAGAVPKDGPSAGITMLVALASLLRGKAIPPRLAMSGEITLTGQVLPVGGIKEKVLAAHRAGVRTLILPKANEKDYLEDVPEEIRREMKVVFVTRATEVLRRVLK